MKELTRQSILWLLLIFMALLETREFGSRESHFKTINRIPVLDYYRIEDQISKDHIHYDYETLDTEYVRDTQFPIPPIIPQRNPLEFSVILACLNEEAIAANALKNLVDFDDGKVTEILAIDANSTDNTYETLKSIKDPRIVVIRLTEVVDYSSTLKYAVSQTAGENILIVDPDFASQKTNLPKIVQNISFQHSPVFLISRTKKEQYNHRFFTFILRALISILFHIKINDPFPLGIICPKSLIQDMFTYNYEANFRIALFAYLSRNRIQPIEIPALGYNQYGLYRHYLLRNIIRISKRLVKIRKKGNR